MLDGGAVEKPMLGRYQVEKELGKGAMGVVYLGKDPKIGRVVAIKTMALSQEFEGEELADARECLFREAETAGRLQHQNIVTIFDAGEEHDLAYIAMEFLKGKDLVDCCKDGQLLPLTKVLSIVGRVAEALAYAHKQNVVHRDIKPSNMMYEFDDDTVKVTDFGIASSPTPRSHTQTGQVLGTPSYMSPEQIAGDAVDGRSDLYSLGVMLFQLLTGMLPFPAIRWHGSCSRSPASRRPTSASSARTSGGAGQRRGARARQAARRCVTRAAPDRGRPEVGAGQISGEPAPAAAATAAAAGGGDAAGRRGERRGRGQDGRVWQPHRRRRCTRRPSSACRPCRPAPGYDPVPARWGRSGLRRDRRVPPAGHGQRPWRRMNDPET